MNTIIFSSNEYFIDEIKDFLALYENSYFFAKSNREVIKILNNKKIDFVIIDSAVYNEFKLIKYINENYQNINVILTMNRDLVDIISTIRTGNYKLLTQPFRLSELKKQLDKGTNGKNK